MDNVQEVLSGDDSGGRRFQLEKIQEVLKRVVSRGKRFQVDKIRGFR